MVLAWGLWDWGSSAYSAVITSFVFGPYVVRGVVGDAQPGGLSANTWLGISTAAAGLLVALIALITGQRADAGGHRKRSLAIWSALVIAVMLGMFSVKNDPSYLWIALVLLAAGAVFQEFAVVLQRDAAAGLHAGHHRTSVGVRLGNGLLRRHLLLLICYVGFIAPDVGWFGVSAAGGLNIRAVAVFSAIWFAVFAIPVLLAVPESPPGPQRRRVSFFASYRLLLNDIKALFRRDRNSGLLRSRRPCIGTAWRRSSPWRHPGGQCLRHGTVHGADLRHRRQRRCRAGSTRMGAVEDRIGPEVIMISLIGLITTSIILLFAHGTTMFWIFGLILTLWVGPAQASSRAFMARLAPVGREMVRCTPPRAEPPPSWHQDFSPSSQVCSPTASVSWGSLSCCWPAHCCWPGSSHPQDNRSRSPNSRASLAEVWERRNIFAWPRVEPFGWETSGFRRRLCSWLIVH